MDLDGGGRRVFNRLGPSSSTDRNHHNPIGNKQQKVCTYWLQGRCTRFPCNFLHSELPSNNPPPKRSYQPFGPDEAKNNNNSNYSSRGGGGLRRSSNYHFNNNNNNSSSNAGSGGGVRQTFSQGGGVNSSRKKIDKLCVHWVRGACTFGDVNCKFLHQFSTDCFVMLTQLDGHQQVITGIALPAGSDKLYTGSQDETVRVWDCQSGQPTGQVALGATVGCMLTEGPWVFVGLANLVKAWNIQTSVELSLSGPVGQVYSLAVGLDLLFAGTQDGSILAWKFNVATNCFEPAASLMGHTLAVVSLVVGGNRMYSGSMDKSIRVWSLETLQCVQTLTGHADVVMSVLCWDQFLLSASLDKTIKIWAATDAGNLEVTYTHTEEHGILTLCGMHDSESKPVLLCSCNDNTIRVYDLPAFSEKGKIFSKKEIRCIQVGPGGLFFTGDGSGEVKVWKWAGESAATS